MHDRIEAVGRSAKEMLGRTPNNMVAIKPLRDGVIADFDAAERMLSDFIKRASPRSMWVRPRVVIGVPAGSRRSSGARCRRARCGPRPARST